MENLYEKLLSYARTDNYPFHMPGHKRQIRDFTNPFAVDITEIYGFDDLHHAEGILKEAQERAADLYGSEETYYLVNGSTCGILAAISACTDRGGTLLMARNSHKSAYHGAFLRDLNTVYLYPEQDPVYGLNGGILPEEVGRALNEDKEIQAVFLVSPTYDGIVSDVRKIAEIAHKKGIPLIVDSAHGAHFGFHPYFPENAVSQGADIVIHSLHKTLPSLTQTALLHVNGRLVDRERLRRFLGIFQTSSPSYVLMAGMDSCVQMIREQKTELFGLLAERLSEFYERAGGLEHIRLAGPDMVGTCGITDFDRSKLVISVADTDRDGKWLADILRGKYHLEPEMEAESYVLALSSVMDTEEGFRRLYKALSETDRGLRKREQTRNVETILKNEVVCSIAEAMEAPGESVLFHQAEGKISQEFVYLYPPGIPLLAPGERISRALLQQIREYRDRGFAVQGTEDHSVNRLKIMMDKDRQAEGL